jgi:hypothetical protein
MFLSGKASGYFYFFGGEAADWINRTVRVATLNALTLEEWIAESRTHFPDTGKRLRTSSNQFTNIVTCRFTLAPFGPSSGATAMMRLPSGVIKSPKRHTRVGRLPDLLVRPRPRLHRNEDVAFHGVVHNHDVIVRRRVQKLASRRRPHRLHAAGG